jgi:hypothetical protein
VLATIRALQGNEGNVSRLAEILRDEKFQDLRYLSESDLRTAEVPPDLPTSEPLVMR